MPLSAEERALLAPYCTNLDRPVFVLRNLPEEVVAVLFAYYSRSRTDLRANLLRLIQDQDLALHDRVRIDQDDTDQLDTAREKARQFHEKWVVGYGHASVAEHAVAHVAIEKVSILASKVVEDARLAAYTEKSTRYVQFEPDAYYRLDELPAEERHLALSTLQQAFAVYAELFPEVVERLRAVCPQEAGQTERAWEGALRAQACDLLRYLLPAATHTNLGMTANARTLEHLISKLLSHPLTEVQALGAAIKTEASAVIPTLIKYAAENAYRRETPAVLRELATEALVGEPEPAAAVTLVGWPPEAEAQLAAALVYEESACPWAQALAAARRHGPEWQRRVIEEALRRRGRHDPPLRALEHLVYTFDVLVDYGAYRDLQRHRMATQTTQLLTTAHGYSSPPTLKDLCLSERFSASMELADACYRRLAPEFPLEAQYVVPLAYRKRVLFTWNLRELHHFISLRSARQGHASYRGIAQQVYRELERVHPFLARFIRVDLEDYRLARE
jgi:thymidylate synthase ThyX